MKLGIVCLIFCFALPALGLCVLAAMGMLLGGAGARALYFAVVYFHIGLEAAALMRLALARRNQTACSGLLDERCFEVSLHLAPEHWRMRRHGTASPPYPARD